MVSPFEFGTKLSRKFFDKQIKHGIRVLGRAWNNGEELFHACRKRASRDWGWNSGGRGSRSKGTGSLSNWRRVEEREVVVQTPVVRACLFAATGYVEDELEELGANLLDGGVTGGDSAGVDVDEIGPSVG